MNGDRRCFDRELDDSLEDDEFEDEDELYIGDRLSASSHGTGYRSHSKRTNNSHLGQLVPIGYEYPDDYHPAANTALKRRSSFDDSPEQYFHSYPKLPPREWKAKHCTFFKNRSNLRRPVWVSDSKYRTLDNLLEDLTGKIDMPQGARTMYTPHGVNQIRSLEQLQHGRNYIVCDFNQPKPLPGSFLNSGPSHHWKYTNIKPNSPQKVYAARLTGRYPMNYFQLQKLKQKRPMEVLPYNRRPAKDEIDMLERTPKKITVYRNGSTTDRQLILLNKRATIQLGDLLRDIGEMFACQFDKLFTPDGKKVNSIREILSGSNIYVAVPPSEKFHRPPGVLRPIGSRKVDTNENVADKPQQSRREKAAGNWTVRVTTSDQPAAGTSALVHIVVYGDKKDSGRIELGKGSRGFFNPGTTDEFHIQVGKLGQIFKIRVGHDNSGGHPDWLLERVCLCDPASDRELTFHFHRWLSVEMDDGHVCREAPAHRKNGDRMYPVVYYEVEVHTGDVWGGETRAEVFVNIFGERGDTGERVLNLNSHQRHKQNHCFKKNQIDVFKVEAVSLGRLKKIIIGHSENRPGEGWYLDSVRIRAPDGGCKDGRGFIASIPKEYLFPCSRWFDSGQDDQKIVRELYPVETLPSLNNSYDEKQPLKAITAGAKPRSPMLLKGSPNPKSVFLTQLEEKQMESPTPIRPKAKFHPPPAFPAQSPAPPPLYCEHEWFTWEVEQWKYEKGNELMFVSHSSSQTLRMMGDGVVDAKGDPKDPTSVLVVKNKLKDNIRTFRGEMHYNLNLAFEHKLAFADLRYSASCEFRVLQQNDRSVVFESVKNPGQFLAFNENGLQLSDKLVHNSKTLESQKSSYLFNVICKGVFRDQGVLIIQSSPTQTLTLDDMSELVGYGSRDITSYFRVRKVSEGRVRMFQSVTRPNCYIQIKDGKCNGMGRGDEHCHFVVEKDKFNGGFRLRSQKYNDLYLGISPSGHCTPLMGIDAQTFALYPEVIQFGKPKRARRMRPDSAADERGVAVNDNELVHLVFETWDIQVETGESGCEEGVSVYLWLYGDKGVERVTLESNVALHNRKLFQSHARDDFQINIPEVGKVFKIRLEHDDAAVSPTNWHVKQVKMHSADSREFLKFKFDRYLSRSLDDGDCSMELPAIRPGEYCLPVINYVIEVQTGDLPGADTESNVFIQLIGLWSDSGKRILHRSNQDSPFESGQLDVFRLKAVHLGPLKSVIVGHDGLAKGAGWYLVSVAVREHEEDMDDKAWLFECNRWLDSSMADKKTEIELTPKPKVAAIEKAEPVASREASVVSRSTATPDTATWCCEAITLDDSTANEWKVPVKLTVYYGSSDEKDSPVQNRCFVLVKDRTFLKPGSRDIFPLDDYRDLGEPLKVRVELDCPDDWVVSGWHLELLTIQNKSLKKEYNFFFNRWLGKDTEDRESVREAPLLNDNKVEVFPVFQYLVMVHIGNRWAADTDSDVWINIEGENGDSGKRHLANCYNNEVKFQRNQMDMFYVEAVSLGRLRYIHMGHDGEGYGAGFFLDKVCIRESEYSPTEYVFMCYQWFDDHFGDCLKERRIRCNGEKYIYFEESELLTLERENTQSEETPTLGIKNNNKLLASSEGVWKVSVTTGSVAMAGTSAKVYVTAVGDQSVSETILLGTASVDKGFFEPGVTNDFMVYLGNIGQLVKLRLFHDNSGDHPDWFVDHILLEDAHTKEQLRLSVDRWLSKEKDDGETFRELPILNINQEPLPVIIYYIKTHTERSGAFGGRPFIQISGEFGDTGERFLVKSLTRTKKFKPGSFDTFLVEAVWVGRPESVIIGHDSTRKLAGWLLKQVDVREGQFGVIDYEFYCNQWLDAGVGDGLTKRTLRKTGERRVIHEKVSKSSNQAGGVIKNQTGPNLHPEGHIWDLWITTGSFLGDSTSANIRMSFYGPPGTTPIEDYPLSTPDTEEDYEEEGELFQLGAVDHFEVKLPAWKELKKVKIVSDNSGDDPSWFVEKLKMKNQQTKDEIRFEAKVWISDQREHSSDLSVEFPAIYPDRPAYSLVIYTVHTFTGNRGAAQTLGEVSLLLKGSEGELGPKTLRKSLNNEVMFVQGQKDTFQFVAASVGSLRSIVVSHNAFGFGAGWYLDKVVIEQDDQPYEYLFPCYRWLDSGVGKGDLCAELFLSSKDEPVFSDYTVSSQLKKAPGKRNFPKNWAFSVTTGPDSRSVTHAVVYLELIGEEGCSSEVFLGGGERDPFYQDSVRETNVFAEGIGKPTKIRLRHDNSGINPDWYFTQVVLFDPVSNDQFCASVDGVISKDLNCGDLVKEVPINWPGDKAQNVLLYRVSIVTGDELGGSTAADVYIELMGELGSTGKRFLRNSVGQKSDPDTVMFSMGSVDEFEVEAVYLGSLSQVRLGHGGKGVGSSWFVDHVTVKEHREGRQCYKFPCNKWLDSEIDDQKTERLFSVDPISLPEDLCEIGDFNVIIYTGADKDAGTESMVTLTACGSLTSVSTDLPNPRNGFQPSSIQQFPCSFGNIGELQKIRLESDNFGINPSWLVHKVVLQSLFTESSYEFEINKWLSSEFDGGHLTREIPVQSSELAVKIYQIVVETVDKSVHQANDPPNTKQTKKHTGKFKAYVKLNGSFGDSGKRVLRKMADKTPDLNFKPGKVSCFNIEAVDLGTIDSILIGFNGDDNIRWKVANIYVKLGSDIDVFVCDRTLGKSEPDRRTEIVVYKNEGANIDIPESSFEPIPDLGKPTPPQVQDPSPNKPSDLKNGNKYADKNTHEKKEVGSKNKPQGAKKQPLHPGKDARAKSKATEDQNALLQSIDSKEAVQVSDSPSQNTNLEEPHEQINEPSEPGKSELENVENEEVNEDNLAVEDNKTDEGKDAKLGEKADVPEQTDENPSEESQNPDDKRELSSLGVVEPTNEPYGKTSPDS